jgi:hypothetical protein
MDSPLTQQLRPDTFEPKIVQLYLHLFNVLANDDSLEDPTPSEGFWREFFLLKPDKQRLFDILEPMTASELLHIHVSHSGQRSLNVLLTSLRSKLRLSSSEPLPKQAPESPPETKMPLTYVTTTLPLADC